MGSLTASEVCDIIGACAKNKVALLQWGELTVRLGVQDPRPPRIPSPWRPGPTPTAAAVVEQEAQSKVALEQDELQLREAQIDELFLTNPRAAEEMLLSGDLKEEDDLEAQD